MWPHYGGHQIRVMRSVWNSIVSEPKTKKSKAPVPVIGPVQKMLDQYRVHCGNPENGVMFATSIGTPLSLNNVLNRQILPALRKAGIQWFGWHAFRRGLATNLHDLGVDDKTIQSILRHSNVAITQNSYIKSLPEQSIAAMKQLESLVDFDSISANRDAQLCKESAKHSTGRVN